MNNELSAISVLLVFITVAFNLVMPDVWDTLSGNYNPEDKGVREYQLSTIHKQLWFKVLPLSVFCLLLAYLLTPKTISIIFECSFELFHFDLLNTLFLVICIVMYFMTALLLLALRQLIKKTSIQMIKRIINDRFVS